MYCAHGEELSQGAAMVLRSIGMNAAYLKDGISGWRACGGAILSKEMQNGVRGNGPSEWITWHDKSVAELACPWFIRRFIDPKGRIHFVERDMVSTIAQEFSAIPFDIPEAPFRLGEYASNLDTLIRYFQVVDPALDQVARVVRGTEQGAPDVVAQHAGLLAVSAGLKELAGNEQQLLSWSLSLFDGLYRWARNQVHPSRSKAVHLS
ncbi:MAG: chromate resistance protein [Hyphomicrobiales bacterium]|nr:chromate resistance protein [Hyphomicrobiales bacterium]